MTIRNYPGWRPAANLDLMCMKCIRSPVAEIWPFAYLGAYGIPILGEGEVVGAAMAPFEKAMVVSYRLSIVTAALSVTIRPQFAIECL